MTMQNLRNLDLNLLVVFEAVFTAGNISQAAKQLGVSQPTISNALTRLRETLDDKLFIRSGRGVAPTPKAARLIVPVRDALQIIQIGMAEDNRFDPAHSKRNFKISVAEPMELVVLPELINQLPQNSRVAFDYFSPLSRNVEEGLMTGAFELAIFLLPSKTPDLNVELLCPVDLVGIARKNHPRLARGEKLTEEAFVKEGHATLNLQPGKVTNAEKVSVLQSPLRRSVIRVSSIGAIARIVGTTDLFGMVPRLFAEHAKDSYGLEIFEPPIEMNKQKMFMIWHKRHDEDSGHIWLRKRVRMIVTAALKASDGSLDT
ncbi:MAG: LysR family transcriptional regulator [Alphaproteobacteria bacterium]|nr:LysR family transcriptional regulator [Alphaproteobacteria bacterium]